MESSCYLRWVVCKQLNNIYSPLHTCTHTQEAGYTYVELNASATRSKRTLHEEVASHLGCLSLDAFVEGRGGGVATGKRHALIMDEVDGMAGNEDRGGVQV